MLDTCSFIWLASDQTQLSQTAKQLIRSSPEGLYVSAISTWEIALKFRKGQLLLSHDPDTWVHRAINKHGITVVPVDTGIAVRSVIGLPVLHKDPADRIIVATALIHNLVILTPDRLIAGYPSVMVRW